MDIEPHKILNLPSQGFTMENLRRNYKVLARQLHPDKRPKTMTNEDANAMFQLFTEAYRKLLEQVEAENSYNMPFDKMRSKARESHNVPRSTSTPHANKFDLQHFNQIFSDNKISDPVSDYGYESWMNGTGPGEESAKQIIQKPKYDLEPCDLSKRSSTPYTELGVVSVSDYSGKAGTDRRSVLFTDYKLAHNTRKLVEDETFNERPELSSLEQLRQYRSKPFTEKTDEELQYEAQMQLERKNEDDQRKQNVMVYDNLHSQTYERLNRLLLNTG
jgi:hypothetical protein